MRKTAIALLLGASFLFVGAAASADPPAGGPPGQGECEHGNSGQECKPDPQPEHGQDCEEHGNEGGVNEDHCLDTTTTVTTTTEPPVVTTTTEPPVITTTTTTAPPVTETETTTTATVPPPVETTTTATIAPPVTTTTAAPPVVTTQAPKPPKGGGAVLRGNKKPQATAFTGPREDTVRLSLIAAGLLLAGLGFLALGRSRRTDVA